MEIGRRDTYAQLLAITSRLNDSLVALCERVIPLLPEMPEPQRTQVADALTVYATELRDSLSIGGAYKRLAETVELQTTELAKAKARLESVRGDLKSVYKSVSETSNLRTRLVHLDDQLSVIARSLNAFGPPVPLADDPILPEA